MTKIVKSKSKISRRLGADIWGRENDKFNSRSYPPGQHGPSAGYKKLSDYGQQFKMHKKFKWYYLMSSRQLKNAFSTAMSSKGITAENLLVGLESRLLTVLFKSGIFPSIFCARHLLSYRHVYVNDGIVNFPEYRLRPGDVVRLKEKAANSPAVLSAIASHQAHRVPAHLEVNIEKRTVTYLRYPSYEDTVLPADMEVSLLIEYFSR